jgi:hypothetical protein
MMPEEREQERTPSSYVVLEGKNLEWAIDAGRVREIVLEAEWEGEAPVDVAALFRDVRDTEGTPRRVIVVETSLGLRGIFATRISYRSFEGREVSALPAVMAGARAAAFVAGLVFDEPQKAVVVLNPEGLSYESRQ